MMSQTANNLISVWGIEYIEEMRIYCQLKNGIIGTQINPTPLSHYRLSPLHISPSLSIHYLLSVVQVYLAWILLKNEIGQYIGLCF